MVVLEYVGYMLVRKAASGQSFDCHELCSTLLNPLVLPVGADSNGRAP